MNLEERKALAERLSIFNEWRRGSDTIPMPHPTQIGEDIDDAIKFLVEGETYD